LREVRKNIPDSFKADAKFNIKELQSKRMVETQIINIKIQLGAFTIKYHSH